MNEKRPIKLEKPILDNIEISKDDDIHTPDEAIAKSVNLLAETRDARTLTDLSGRNEVKILSALDVQSDILNDTVLSQLVATYPRWAVSEKRKGRGEIMQIAKAQREEQKEKQSMWKKLFGIK